MMSLLSLAQAVTGQPVPTDTSPGTFWMPQDAAAGASSVDTLFYAILAISAVCFIGITIAVIVFVAKYRHREGHRAESSSSHNDVLEITWTVLPSIVVVIIFVIGWRSFANMKMAPKHAHEVIVTAQKWSWTFQYPNGHIDSVLHVPVDEPVRLVMTSDDVIHSFFVPAFRAKQDVLPKRFTTMWFEATKVGTYQAYCAEYCGQQHSKMLTTVVVHEPGGYEKYLEQAAEAMLNMPPRELGELIYKQRGCAQCHSIDGASGTGPTFKGLWASTGKLADGSTITVDENYIRESILEPQAKVRLGFNPVMPTFQGKLKEREIIGIIEYIKSLE